MAQIKGFQTFGKNHRMLETLFFLSSKSNSGLKSIVGLRLENCFLPCELRELLFWRRVETRKLLSKKPSERQ